MEESLGLFQKIKEEFSIKEHDLRTFSPLTLAFIGDGIYDVVIRTLIVGEGNQAVNKMHKRASSMVKAEAQSEMILVLQDQLTDQEMTIFKRGRNAKSNSAAKNASIGDYRRATGFEALMGYLYLTDQTDRMLVLIKMGLIATGRME
jgi:ribonuclease-3 family protein